MAGRKRKAPESASTASTNTPRTFTSQIVTRSASKKANKAALHNAVFLTTELLELILEQLPMRDLLLAQRVSRKWRDVIKKSKHIQQMLYFVPKDTDFLWRYTWASESPSSVDLLKVRADYVLKPEEKDTTMLFDHTSLNPLVAVNDDDVVNYWIAGDEGGYVSFEFVMMVQNTAWRYPEASWRRMLATQPPTTFISSGDIMDDIVESCGGFKEEDIEWEKCYHYLSLIGNRKMMSPSEKSEQRIFDWNDAMRAKEEAARSTSTNLAQA